MPSGSPLPVRAAAVLAGLLAAFALAGLSACAPRPPEDARPQVFVSVLPQQYAVQRIAGDRVRVEVMIPPGASPITHEPTLAQLARLQKTRLYVKVGHPGFPFEAAWLDRMLADAPHVVVVDGSAGVAGRTGDPHWWLAPAHMEQMAIAVADALSALVPEERDAFAAGLAGFRAEIRALDAELQAELGSATGRSFLVFHPAWGYFARAYGLRQVAIEHDHKAPDARALAALIVQARQDQVRVVFVQPQLDAAAARTLADEIGARVETLDPLAYDWPDNLRTAARAIAGAAG